MVDVLLITPPFTQLNTPYPATAYLKGFLNTKHIRSFQADLGIDVILHLFNATQLQQLFNLADQYTGTISDNACRISSLRNLYVQRVDAVIRFLQGQDPTLAHAIGLPSYLPQASRFKDMADVEHAFGNMGITDKAKYLATLFLEDISDFIQETIDPHFGFSRYAERLARSAYSFDELYHSLHQPLSLVDELTLKQLKTYVDDKQPSLIALSVPFPGNVYAALRCGQYIKQHYPKIKVALGGGFANTELRSLSDPRVFEYLDYVCLDDGEAPMEHIWKHTCGKLETIMLKRCFVLEDNQVVYHNGSLQRDYKQTETGTPDYSDLRLAEYISVLEVLNPMNRLWSDGRWNKLTMAHGCYWGKCTFCDVSLDYIKNYEPIQAGLLVDRMEELIRQTGHTGFHFVDEAAPPALMRELAVEILRRKLTVSWWTNIRFEKSFSDDLCYLLKLSGCIGVSGGLEVASERLLTLIDKGITLPQVTRVLRNFRAHDIMVHAYLMYGYPTQTAQETIDSLEIVRQLFASGILKSAFWHQFALTVHSPIGLNPSEYEVIIDPKAKGSFANNDLIYTEKNNRTDHASFSFGLKKALFNYMHEQLLEAPLSSWFDVKVPATSHDPNYIMDILNQEQLPSYSMNANLYWVNPLPEISFYTKSKKGRQWAMCDIKGYDSRAEFNLSVAESHGRWLMNQLDNLSINHRRKTTFAEFKQSFEQEFPEDDFDLIFYNKMLKALQSKGLIIV